MTVSNDLRSGNAVLLRGVVLLAFIALLVWHQAAVARVAAAALGGESSGGSLRAAGFSTGAVVPLAATGLLLLVAGPARAFLLLVAGGLLVLLLSADIAYLRTFERPFSVEMLVLLDQGWSVRDSAAKLLRARDAAALATVAVLAALDLFLSRRGRSRKAAPAKLLGLILLAAAAPSVVGAWSKLDRRVTRVRDVFADLEMLRAEGALLYHVADVGRSVRRRARRPPLDAERAAALDGALARRWQQNRAPSPLRGIAAGRSVILLQLESIESFVVSRTVPGGALTPTLDRLRGDALEFDRCHDLAAAGRTSDAEFMTLTSLRPDPLRPVAYRRRAVRYTALPGLLGARGYRTLSLHAYEPWFWNRAVMHPLYGIREMWFDETFSEGERLFLGLGDADFLTQAAERLARVPRPFFALCITLSCHHPFGVVPPALESFDVGFEDDEMAAGYLRLVRYTDEAVGLFLRALERSGLARESIVVVYGDHVSGLPAESRRRLGERLGTDASPLASQRVPLLFVVPGEEEALRAEKERVRDAPCSLQDVAPTVLHLLGVEIPAGWLGVHLLADVATRPAVPLRGGLGLSAPGLLSDVPSVIVGTARWREAKEELRLAEAARLHDGQARAAEWTEAELRALATSAPVAFERPEDAAPWEVRFETKARALDAGVRVVASLPAPPMPLDVDLTLTNPGPTDGDYRFETFTIDGAAAATLRGTLAPGERRTLELSRDGVLVRAGAAWGRLVAPASVAAWLTQRSPFGDARRDLVSRTASRIAVRGSAADVDLALVVLVNPGEASVDATIEVEVEGDASRTDRRTVPARSLRTLRVPLDGRDGLVKLSIEGDGLVVRVLRFSNGGGRVR